MSLEKKRKPAREGDDGGSGSSSSEFHSDSDSYAWISWFCSLKGNEFFCEVDDSFVQDGFNLTGLSSHIQYFDHALDLILDIEPTEVLNDEQQELVENDAEILFGLIHARYILTTRGLHAMLEKYRQCHFGRCPRVMCRGQAVLPCGLSDIVNSESVKLYCPKCEDVYSCRSTRHENIDGAYFGATFPHLFFLTFPELKVSKASEVYVPRVFGFRVHKDAYSRSLEARKNVKAQESASKVAPGSGAEGAGERPVAGGVPSSSSKATASKKDKEKEKEKEKLRQMHEG